MIPTDVLVLLPLLIAAGRVARYLKQQRTTNPGPQPWEDVNQLAAVKGAVYLLVAAIIVFIAPSIHGWVFALAMLLSILLAVTTVLAIVDLPPGSFDDLLWRAGPADVSYIRWVRRLVMVLFALFFFIVWVYGLAVERGVAKAESRPGSLPSPNAAPVVPTAPSYSVPATTAAPTSSPATSTIAPVPSTTAPPAPPKATPAADACGVVLKNYTPPKVVPFDPAAVYVCVGGSWSPWTTTAPAKVTLIQYAKGANGTYYFRIKFVNSDGLTEVNVIRTNVVG